MTAQIRDSDDARERRAARLVTLDAMVAALVQAIEAPLASGMRIVEVPEIRQAQLP